MQREGGVVIITYPGLKEVPEDVEGAAVAVLVEEMLQGPDCAGPGAVQVKVGYKECA